MSSPRVLRFRVSQPLEPFEPTHDGIFLTRVMLGVEGQRCFCTPTFDGGKHVIGKDVFICHASEDKVEVVRMLVKAFSQAGN